MSARFDDARDLVAITLMGWAAKLATKQYQRYLASCIQTGMTQCSATWTPVEADERLARPDECKWCAPFEEHHPEWQACK